LSEGLERHCGSQVRVLSNEIDMTPAKLWVDSSDAMPVNESEWGRKAAETAGSRRSLMVVAGGCWHGVEAVIFF
jgi:hypothetical protein